MAPSIAPNRKASGGKPLQAKKQRPFTRSLLIDLVQCIFKHFPYAELLQPLASWAVALPTSPFAAIATSAAAITVSTTFEYASIIGASIGRCWPQGLTPRHPTDKSAEAIFNLPWFALSLAFGVQGGWLIGRLILQERTWDGLTGRAATSRHWRFGLPIKPNDLQCDPYWGFQVGGHPWNHRLSIED